MNSRGRKKINLSDIAKNVTFDEDKSERAEKLLRSLFTEDLTFTFEGNYPPRRAYSGDAGLDLAIQEDVSIKPGETLYLPSGVAFDVPEGFAVHVMTRSSTFMKGVVVIPTIIDHSYKDVCSTIVTNNSNRTIYIKGGDRLAQAVLIPVIFFDNEDVECKNRMRNGGRFGSSG